MVVTTWIEEDTVEDMDVIDTLDIATDSILKEHIVMTIPHSMEGCLRMDRTRTTIVTIKGTTGEICTIVTTIMEECQGEAMVME